MLTSGGGAAGRAKDVPLARKVTRTWARILLVLLTATEGVAGNTVILTLSIYNEGVICVLVAASMYINNHTHDRSHPRAGRRGRDDVV